MTTSSTSPPLLRFDVGSTVVPGDRLGATLRRGGTAAAAAAAAAELQTQTQTQIQTQIQIQSGPGTHVEGGHIYASLVGQLQLTPLQVPTSVTTTTTTTTMADDDDDDATHTNEEQDEVVTAADAKTSPICQRYECSVSAIPSSTTNTTASPSPPPPATAQILFVGQLVVGIVTRITPQNAVVQVRVAERVGTLAVPTEGAIRLEDVRSSSSSSSGNKAASLDPNMSIGDCFQPGDLVACRVLALGDARRYFLSTAETELGVLRATSKHAKHTSSTSTISTTVPMIPLNWKQMECPETGVKESRKCAKPLDAARLANLMMTRTATTTTTATAD